MINVTKERQEVKNFNEWLNKGGDLIEKIVSIVVLIVELILLFFHNVDESISFYLFTGLNLSFSLFIWYTFVKGRNNMFYTLDEEFGLKESDELKKYKEDEDLEKKPNSKAAKERFKEKENIYIKSFSNTDAIDGNLLIQQFSHIRYAWLFTAILYIFIIINHLLFNDSEVNKDLIYLKPWFNGGILMINLLSTYFYLVAYHVTYYSPLKNPRNEYPDKSIEEIPQYFHFKKTSWWFGLMFLILIGYISSYNYYKLDSYKFSHIVLCENNKGTKPASNYIRITGEKVLIMKDENSTIINDPDENQTFVIQQTDHFHNDLDTLKIVIDELHKKQITLIDTIHRNFLVTSHNNKITEGKLTIVAAKKDASIHFDSDKKIKNIEFQIKNPENNASAIDFIFQIITGILSALIMCFFVGRFESLTFQTPPWILVILYFYAVIQGFLVILNVDFIKENEFLISAHDKISKLVFFVALLGKVVLYIYLIGLFSTKRLFYYFNHIKKEIEEMEQNCEDYWHLITSRKK